jgi:hypothetical protein
MLNNESLGGLHATSHAYYNTTCPERCDLADKRTAKLTITPRAFLGATVIDHRISAIADHLGCTPAVVQAFLDSLPDEEWRALARLTGRL